MSIYKIVISQSAELEYASAYHYYEDQLVGLGDRFEKETDFLIDKLKQNPYLFERRFKYYREANLNKFPYFIIYEIIADSVIIHSFFHSKRHPAKKLKRKK